MRVIATAVVVLALAAHPVAADDGVKVKLKKPTRGFQMRAGDYVVPPGEDLEWCEYRRLPSNKEMFVSRFDLRMSYGSHHFSVWTYNGPEQDDAKFPQQPVLRPGCVGLGPGELIGTNLFGMQTPNGSVRFPPGVAARLKPHQQVWLNPHIKNFGTVDVIPQIVFNFVPARKGRVEHVAEAFAIGSTDIDVAAGGRRTLVAEWRAPTNLNVIQMAGHQHQWGTYVMGELEQADGSFEKVYENGSWQHPFQLWTHEETPWKDRDPPVMRVEAGRRIRFTCKWENKSGKRVTFGTEVDDEMCFLGGYFYRDDGAPSGPIRGPGCLASREGLTCTGAQKVSSVPE